MADVSTYIKNKLNATLKFDKKALNTGYAFNSYEEYKKSGLFNNSQLELILDGFSRGLKPEQIALYAIPIYDYYKMRQIKYAVEDGLTKEQISMLLNPRYDDAQMIEIRLGLRQGLTIEQVKTYANIKYDFLQMEAKRTDLLYEKLMEKLSSDTYQQISKNRIKEIMYELRGGLSIEKAIKNAEKREEEERMEREKEKNAKSEDETIRLKDMGVNVDEICSMLKFSKEKLKLFDFWQIREMQDGLKLVKEGELTIEDVLTYVDPKLTWEQMKEIRKGFELALEGYIDKEDVRFYAKPLFSPDQMHEIREGFILAKEGKITKKDVYEYANPNTTAYHMRKIREGIMEMRKQEGGERMGKRKAVDTFAFGSFKIDPR